MTVAELIGKHVRVNYLPYAEAEKDQLKKFAIELLEHVRENPWREYSATGGVLSEDHLSAINSALEELRK